MGKSPDVGRVSVSSVCLSEPQYREGDLEGGVTADQRGSSKDFELLRKWAKGIRVEKNKQTKFSLES